MEDNDEPEAELVPTKRKWPAPYQIEYDGRIQSLRQWAAEYAITPALLSKRLREGWPIGDALEIPVSDRGISYDDPASLTEILTEINVSVALRVKRSLPKLHKWIDENMERDPSKVAGLVEKLSGVYDRYAKHNVEKQAGPAKSVVNISLNTSPPPKPDRVFEVRND